MWSIFRRGPTDVSRLAETGDVKGLIRCLEGDGCEERDRDPARRAGAALALARLGQTPREERLRDRAAEALLAAAADDDPELATTALTALPPAAGGLAPGALRQRVIALLSAVLAHGTVERRRLAAQGLATCAARWFPHPLAAAERASALSLSGEALLAAANDPAPETRAAAAAALGALGASSASPLLVTALTDTDRAVRTAAAHALTQLDWRAASDHELAAHALAAGDIERCVALGAAAAPLLAAELDSADAGAAEVAAAALARIGDPAVGELALVLGRDAARSRPLACQILAGVADATLDAEAFLDAVDALCAATSDPDLRLAQAAVDALGQLAGRMLDQPEVRPLVAAAVAEALTRLGPAGLTAARVLDLYGWRRDRGPAEAFYLAEKGDWERCAALGPVAVVALRSSRDPGAERALAGLRQAGLADEVAGDREPDR